MWIIAGVGLAAASLVAYGVVSGAMETPGWLESECVYLGCGEGPAAALQGDPAGPYRWCMMGEYLEESGEKQAATVCFRRAVELGRGVPPVLMRVANSYLGRGENAEAVALMRDVLGQVSVYDGVIFGSYRRLGVPVAEVLDSGLPDDGRVWKAYFEDLLGSGEVDEAALAWGKMGERGYRDDELAGRYAGYLLRHKLYDKAVTTWAEQLDGRADGYPEKNRVYNGDFERELSGNPLDWRLRAPQGVEVERVGEGWEGSHALALRFDGSRNVVLRGVSVVVPVGAGRYRFRARMKTEGMTTDRGVYLLVHAGGRELWRSKELIGTNEWREFEAVVRVRRTAPVMIELRREESLRIDNKVWGTVWLDGVELAPL